MTCCGSVRDLDSNLDLFLSSKLHGSSYKLLVASDCVKDSLPKVLKLCRDWRSKLSNGLN